MLNSFTIDASGKIVVALVCVFVLVIAAVGLALPKTSSTQFCLSCHEMKVYRDELKRSSHELTKDKQAIECKDCHIPIDFGGRYLIVKTTMGVKDLISHYFGDPDNLDRRKLQESARRFVPDENCRACHEDLEKDTDGNMLSEIGKLSHDAYLGKNGQTRRGCAGCHFNMAHLPDFDRRYHFNAEFAKNLPLKKEPE